MSPSVNEDHNRWPRRNFVAAWVASIAALGTFLGGIAALIEAIRG